MTADRALVEAFCRGLEEGESPTFRVERDILAVHRGAPPPWAVLLRLSATAYLLRADPGPPGTRRGRRLVREVLAVNGLQQVPMEDPRFAEVAGIMVASLRHASWELWGRDRDLAWETLERLLVGEPGVPLASLRRSPDEGRGLTVDELLADVDREIGRTARRIAGLSQPEA